MDCGEIKEELASFFQRECKEIGLTDNFVTGHKVGRTFWTWNIADTSDSVRRIVEVGIYPDKAIEVLAKVLSASFKERYRSNEKVIGVLKLTEKLDTVWLQDALHRAGKFARNNDLLEISISDAMPGTYRDVL
ncbi:MAG: hypothetical protein WDZ40_00590 [Candidatus Spechtbacterales bacterium]